MDILVNSNSHANTDYAKRNKIWQINNSNDYKHVKKEDFIFIKTSTTNKVELLGIVETAIKEACDENWPVHQSTVPNPFTIRFREVSKNDFTGGVTQASLIYKNKVEK